MATIELTLQQCRQIVANGGDLRELIDQWNNQPVFLTHNQMGEIESISEIQDISQSGCSSGAYMPAVTYYNAVQCMNDCSVEVFDFLEGIYGEIPQPQNITSWSGLAVFYVSCAVEAWCQQFVDVLECVDWD